MPLLLVSAPRTWNKEAFQIKNHEAVSQLSYVAELLNRLAGENTSSSQRQTHNVNPNDQAMINQMLHNLQQWTWGFLAIQVVMVIAGGWVIYMFYARLRDIADELRKIRVRYEMEQDQAARARTQTTAASSVGNPVSDDARYMPKK